MSTVALFEDKKVKGLIKSNLRKIQDSNLNSTEVLQQLTKKLQDKYTVINTEGYEITIKPDKRKNLDQVEQEVINLTASLIKGFDINFLFRILKSSSDIIVQAKRIQ